MEFTRILQKSASVGTNKVVEMHATCGLTMTIVPAQRSIFLVVYASLFRVPGPLPMARPLWGLDHI